MSKRKTFISFTTIVIIIIAIAGIIFAWKSTTKQEVSTQRPVDVVLDFYQPWLEAAQSTTTDPHKEGATESPFLSKELRKQLKNKPAEGDIDPVLCRTAIPEKIAAITVYQTEEEAEVLVTARPSTMPEQSIVKLLSLNGGWYIDSIRCAPGEFGPDREYTFDMEGSLLKDVPEPLDSQYWHLVFEEADEPGHFAPLFFSSESVCVAADGSEGVCNPDTFIETGSARVQGEMTEKGVQVKRMELKK